MFYLLLRNIETSLANKKIDKTEYETSIIKANRLYNEGNKNESRYRIRFKTSKQE